MHSKGFNIEIALLGTDEKRILYMLIFELFLL